MTPVLLSVFGEIETFISEELYPYRIPITVVVIAALLVGVYAAYRAELHLFLWRHRLASTVVGVPALVVVVVVGNYLVSPLFDRSYANEAPPAVGVAADLTTPAAEPTPAMAVAATEGIVLRGEFVGADELHFGRGNALIIETAPGQYVLRFEDFSVRNGPDLYVYLSPDPEGYASGASELGTLKATDGAFNYDVPAGLDLAQMKSAVVWCKQFSVLFAHATLAPPQ